MNRFIRFIFLVLGITIVCQSNGQTTLFLEDFSGLANGTQNATGRFTTSYFDTDDGMTNNTNYNQSYWGVRNGEFCVNDIEGPGDSCENYFNTDTFGIRGFCDVVFSMDVIMDATSGDKFDCGLGLVSDDWLITMYRIDGGAWDTFATNGYICGNFADTNFIVSDTCLEGNYMEIQIQVGNKSNTEKQFFDNIRVAGYNYNDFVQAGPDQTICTGSSANLSATGAKDYNWITGGNLSCTNCAAPTASPVNTTLYVVEGSINSCVDKDTVNVTVNSAAGPDLGNDTSVCLSSGYTLDAGTGFSSYQWSTGANSQTISINSPGTYWVTAGGGSCQGSDTITISSTVNIDLGSDQQACNGDQINLTTGGGYTSYLWNTGATGPMINASVTGSYWVRVEQAGCFASDTVDLTFADIPDNLLGPDTFVCDGSSIVLNAGPGYDSYLWNIGFVSPSITVATVDIYTVDVTLGSCSKSDSVFVDVFYPPAQLDLGTDTTLCEGEQLRLTVNGNGSTVVWQDNSGGNSFLVTQAGLYSVSLSNACGQGSDQIQVSFQDCAIDTPTEPIDTVIPPSVSTCGFLVPTAFTPNFDNVNDYLQPLTNCDTIPYTFQVFGRWGNQLYFGNQNMQGWNAFSAGVPTPVGVYVWVLRYVINGEEIVQSGNTTLLR